MTPMTGEEGAALRSLSENVGALAREIARLRAEVRMLEWTVPVIAGGGLALIGIIAAVT